MLDGKRILPCIEITKGYVPTYQSKLPQSTGQSLGYNDKVWVRSSKEQAHSKANGE